MTTADEISKLHELLTKGALTQPEFEQAKARLLGAGAGAVDDGLSVNRLRLSNRDKWFGGVCGGIGGVTGVEAWIWRLIFVLGSIVTGGVLAIFYILLWIFVPRED